MERKKCFKGDCPNEAEYLCQCIPSGIYSCESHVGEHLKLVNKAHACESIFIEPCKGTKEEIIKVLEEKNSRHSKLKEKLLDYYSKYLISSEHKFTELIKGLHNSSDKLEYFFSKIIETKRILKNEQDPILKLLSLKPKEAAEKVKFLSPTYPYWLENAEDELRISFSLNNPYIISLDSYFKAENKADKVLKNFTLLKAIADKQTKKQEFEEDEIWKYFIQISFGIEALHSKGFAHRDIKPGNIILDENNDVKLVDFALTKYLEASSVKETLQFYTPEMPEGDFPTKESDIWALGYIICYLCNLDDPFMNNKKKIHCKVHMPIKSKYSQKLRHFVDWCLRWKKNERPKINEIITDLFIINKAISLGIQIPTTSAMNKYYLSLLNSEIEKNANLESNLSESNNTIIDQKAEIDHLKSEIASLKELITMKDNFIEIFSSKLIKVYKFLEKCKINLNEKQLVELKNSIRDLAMDAEKTKNALNYSEHELVLSRNPSDNKKKPNIIIKEPVGKGRIAPRPMKISSSSSSSSENKKKFNIVAKTPAAKISIKTHRGKKRSSSSSSRDSDWKKRPLINAEAPKVPGLNANFKGPNIKIDIKALKKKSSSISSSDGGIKPVANLKAPQTKAQAENPKQESFKKDNSAESLIEATLNKKSESSSSSSSDDKKKKKAEIIAKLDTIKAKLQVSKFKAKDKLGKRRSSSGSDFDAKKKNQFQRKQPGLHTEASVEVHKIITQAHINAIERRKKIKSSSSFSSSSDSDSKKRDWAKIGAYIKESNIFQSFNERPHPQNQSLIQQTQNKQMESASKGSERGNCLQF